MHQDVILGVPWFHRKSALLKFPERIITFSHKGKELEIKVNVKGQTIPIVNHVQIQKSIKSTVCAYLIFAKDVSNEHEHLTSNIANDAQEEQEHFLQEYVDCFSETLPMEMPPSRGEDDHRIDLVIGRNVNLFTLRYLVDGQMMTLH